MKTILYQPIFINPQAYFVFPQLYHIEKGDSYIEPANITGQLIIQNLSCNAEIPEQENSILLVDGTSQGTEWIMQSWQIIHCLYLMKRSSIKSILLCMPMIPLLRQTERGF